MDYLRDFSGIWSLLRYFNQDWVLQYLWEDKEPSFQPVIRYYKTNNPREITEQLIFEIDKFLHSPLKNEEFDAVLVEELGMEYTPRSQGLSKRQFLEKSLQILKEPDEETQREFIPKFIG